MIDPKSAELFRKIDAASHGHSLKSQIDAACLLIYQAVVTASRASGIPRREVLANTLTGMANFIAICDVVECQGDARDQGIANKAIAHLIPKQAPKA